jgi:membrane-bound ClpP family serine protease
VLGDLQITVFGVPFSVYALIMLVFFVFLLVALVIGDIGDFLNGGDVDTGVDTGLSPVSLPVIGVFGTAFGGFGTLFEGLGYGPILTPVLAVTLAIATAGGVWAVMLRIFVKTQSETRVDLSSLVGYKGQVIIPIKPGQPGQVVVITEARGRTLLQAIADEMIGTDEHVTVESVVGSSVKVRKI